MFANYREVFEVAVSCGGKSTIVWFVRAIGGVYVHVSHLLANRGVFKVYVFFIYYFGMNRGVFFAGFVLDVVEETRNVDGYLLVCVRVVSGYARGEEVRSVLCRFAAFYEGLYRTCRVQ